MAKKKLAKEISSTKLTIYLLDKSRSPKEEGTINLHKTTAKMTNTSVHFDSLDDIPEKIRKLLDKGGVTWPRN